MNNAVGSFSGFSVDSISKVKDFYLNTLGLKLVDDKMGLELELPGGGRVFIYGKPDHQPATFTVLNFVVTDIDATVEELSAKGITFEHYDLGNGAEQDEKGVLRGLEANMGPDIAWFKDPCDNILAVLQDTKNNG